MHLEFDWDEEKNTYNKKEHRIPFELAQYAFFDPNRFIIFDEDHSDEENRWFCIGKVKGRIMAVRFTMRDQVVRIIGAGYWRKWRKEYERRNSRQ